MDYHGIRQKPKPTRNKPISQRISTLQNKSKSGGGQGFGQPGSPGGGQAVTSGGTNTGGGGGGNPGCGGAGGSGIVILRYKYQ